MAKKGKSKGFLGKAASFLGSIPGVGNVAKKAKKAVKSTAKKAGNAVKATAKKAKTAAKSTAKKAKKAVKSTVKKAKKAASSAKKKVKKKAKKAKKKLGKVYTKARKTANNLSKSKMVKQVKQAAKKAVLTTKKAAQKTKTAVKKAGKQVKAAVKDTKKVMTKVAGKIAKTATKEIKNPVVKSFNSFKEIGSDFKSGLDTRTNKALNSPYDFANYLTLGAVDGIWSGSKSRMDKKFDSPSDFLNYASFGFTGMVQGAVNPKDPLSKEHWLDSFGVATSVLGVKGVSSTKTAGVTSGKSTSSSSSSNSKSNKGTGEISNSVGNSSRIEYLHNKYGRFTSQELNQRINLRGAVEKEVERLDKSGLTKNEMGPAVAGTFDKTSGKYYFGINNTAGDIPVTLHPIIEDRIYNMPSSVKDGYKFTYGAGSHAEVYSLNQALLANPNALPTDFITHVVRSGKKLKPAGMMMPTCPHCNFITEGFEFSSEVKKVGK